MGLFGRKAEPENQATGAPVTLDGGETVTATTVVDCIGDSCPRPQIFTRNALGKARSGDVIEVKIDNPTSMEALPPIIEENGGTHLGTLRRARHWQVLLKKN